MTTLTILGSFPGWAHPGIASSGYILEHEGFTLLLDCGHGVAAAWRQRSSAAPDAIVLSHAHADHVADLPAFKYATQWGPLAHRGRPLLVATPETLRVLEEIEYVRSGQRDFYQETYDFLALNEDTSASSLQVGPFSIRALRVPHLIPTWALRVEVAGTSFTYSADSGLPVDELIDFAKQSDLLLIEAGLPEDMDVDENLARIHLTPTTAINVARLAEVKQAVVTHLGDLSYAKDVLQAQQKFWPEGQVSIAKPGAVYNF